MTINLFVMNVQLLRKNFPIIKNCLLQNLILVSTGLKKTSVICALHLQKKSDVDKVNEQEEYDLHLARKEEAREHKQLDKDRGKEDNTFAVFAMDMEKVLVTPSINVGKLYYLQKLKTYNFTIYNLSNKSAANYMWHEGVGKKGSSEIATCLWRCLSKLDDYVKEVTFFADTAAGQNRNVINAAMFLRAVNEFPIKIINQKFMESGHSEMECDSVHSVIERRGAKVDIFTPDGWYSVAKTAKMSEPYYKVIEMDYSDFINFKNYSKMLIKNKNKSEDGSTVNWLKIKWLQYRKNDPLHIFYKERLSDPDFKSIKIRKVPARANNVKLMDALELLYSDPLPIEHSKLRTLRQLCESGTIPSTYHPFYDSLASKESSEDIVSSEEDA